MSADIKKKVEAYIKDVLERFEKKPDTLDSNERRLLVKYRRAKEVLAQLNADMEQLVVQINQAQARLRETENHAHDAQGKATGIIEALAALKFDLDGVAEESTPEIPTEISKGNGSSDPTERVGNRKARRAAKAKAKKEVRRQSTKQ